MIDFKKTAVIKTANPRKGDDSPVIKTKDANAPRSPFQIEMLPAKDRVKLSQWLFNNLQLASNSLANGTHPDLPGKMLLIVCPGDTGKWANGRGNKDKGRSFKNANLIKGLRELGFTSNFFNLEHVGDDEGGKKYYMFVPYEGTDAVASVDTSEAEAEEQGLDQVEDTTKGEDKFN